MPFVEIGRGRRDDWVYIQPRMITISVSLRRKFVKNKYFRFFYDDKNKLLAIKEDNIGYRLDINGRLYCAKVARIIPVGKYKANWDGEQVIADINQKVE